MPSLIIDGVLMVSKSIVASLRQESTSKRERFE
jgi:hypothetical protein